MFESVIVELVLFTTLQELLLETKRLLLSSLTTTGFDKVAPDVDELSVWSPCIVVGVLLLKAIDAIFLLCVEVVFLVSVEIIFSVLADLF